jgi:hypothetical protein
MATVISDLDCLIAVENRTAGQLVSHFWHISEIVDRAVRESYTREQIYQCAMTMLAARSRWGAGDGKTKVDPGAVRFTAEEFGVGTDDLRAMWEADPVIL